MRSSGKTGDVQKSFSFKWEAALWFCFRLRIFVLLSIPMWHPLLSFSHSSTPRCRLKGKLQSFTNYKYLNFPSREQGGLFLKSCKEQQTEALLKCPSVLKWGPAQYVRGPGVKSSHQNGWNAGQSGCSSAGPAAFPLRWNTASEGGPAEHAF